MGTKDTYTFAGTQIAITADIPATFDQAGWEGAGIVFTDIGSVVSVPDPEDIEWSDVSFTVVSNGYTHHRKGTKEIPEKSFDVMVDNSDGGQILLKQASNTAAYFGLKSTMPDGQIVYCLIQVYKKGGDGGSNDDMRQHTINFRIEPETTASVDPAP